MPIDAIRDAPEPAAPQKSEDNVGPTVRFKSTVQEIDPQHSLSDSPPSNDDRAREVSPEDLKALSKSLQGHSLQERRMNIFNFEAYSLPASRVCRYSVTPCSKLSFAFNLDCAPQMPS